MNDGAEPAARSAVGWPRSMKLLLALTAVVVALVVVVGGVLLALSGPSPLMTQAVNFPPASATSVIDRCSQSHGFLRVSGTTTATATTAWPVLAVSVLDTRDGPGSTQRPLQLPQLRQGQSTSWSVTLPARQPVSGCFVGTLSVRPPGT